MKPYVFYDGPPFATGLPHYGHILQGVGNGRPDPDVLRGIFRKQTAVTQRDCENSVSPLCDTSHEGLHSRFVSTFPLPFKDPFLVLNRL